MSLDQGGSAIGAAVRRRERRLSAAWRHEQLGVAMGHHSASPE